MTSAAAAPQPLSQIQGAAAKWEFTVTRDGVALNITGMALVFNIFKRAGRAPVISSETVGTLVVVSSPYGADLNKFYVLLPDEITDLYGDYHYLCEVEDSDGMVVPVAYGPYSFVPG